MPGQRDQHADHCGRSAHVGLHIEHLLAAFCAETAGINTTPKSNTTLDDCTLIMREAINGAGIALADTMTAQDLLQQGKLEAMDREFESSGSPVSKAAHHQGLSIIAVRIEYL
ncbi:hypothetical protein NKJ59_03140 [Mesorhizobium australicum]|uniref:hypothetical protein n=1 Tax=Mesorhizobium australicum TaxID=536018 RepID=UPI00334F1CF5